MQISELQLSKFQMLYKKHFGEDISIEDALYKGTKLVCLFETLLKERSRLAYGLLTTTNKY